MKTLTYSYSPVIGRIAYYNVINHTIMMTIDNFILNATYIQTTPSIILCCIRIAILQIIYLP